MSDSRKILLLAAKMLELSSEVFSNRGSNDLDDEVIGILKNDNKILWDITEHLGEEDGPILAEQVGDDTLMSFLSDKIKALL